MKLQSVFRLVPVLLWLSLVPFRPLAAQYYSQGPGRITLDNGVVHRSLDLGENGDRLTTLSYGLKGLEDEFVRPGGQEFGFLADGHAMNGLGGWKITSVDRAADSLGGDGVRLTYKSASTAKARLHLEVTYLLYPELPVVRKHLSLVNLGQEKVRLEAVDVEVLRSAWEDTDCWIMSDFARHKWLGPFVGNWNDPLAVVHMIGRRQGLALGNEAPSVTKRTGAFEDGSTFSVGLTRPDQDYPFLAWLKPGEKWESPWVFSLPYAGQSDPAAVVNGPVADFVRRHMGIRLAQLDRKPMFVYNTWNPFRTQVNEALVNELAEAAAACGAQEFVIDDGWQANKGDWEIDYQKFPNGLKPVFDHIRSLGMKPGLWISLTEAETKSKVYAAHPEWFCRDKAGRVANIHSSDPNTATACLGTDWYGHIRDVILGLVRDHGLGYVKLDLSLTRSAYVYDKTRTGCYATDHPFHDGREESFLVAYRRCMQLFDELHAAAPDLFIDCTFETWGPLQQVDYALVRHAEGDWLINVYEKSPLGSLRVRNLAWWRTPSMPATALVVGNLTLDDPERELNLLSLAGTLPIMLGDPRKVPPESRARLKAWADWLQAMQDKYNYTLYRSDLPGFGEPAEGQWDGWQRINTDTRAGGIVGVFRQAGLDSERMVGVSGLDPAATYSVRRGPAGEELTRMSGADLAAKGFRVSLPDTYGAVLFEIQRVQ